LDTQDSAPTSRPGYVSIAVMAISYTSLTDYAEQFCPYGNDPLAELTVPSLGWQQRQVVTTVWAELP
jgi:hypothetical protein